MDTDKYRLLIDSLSNAQATVLKSMLNDFQKIAWT